MLGLFLVLVISLFISFKILHLVSHAKIISYSFIVIYCFWYLPPFLSFVLPFDYFSVKDESFFVSLLTLSLLNLILYSGASVVLKKGMNFSFFFKKLSTNSGKKFLFVYIPIAYLSPVLDFYKKLSRGYNLSLDSIAHNRSLGIQTYESGIISYLSNITIGFTLFLLFFSLDRQGKKISVNYIYFSPFLIMCFLVLVGGSKLTIFMGFLLLIFRLIQLFEDLPRRILTFIVATMFFLIPIFLWQNLVRSKITTLDLGEYSEVVELNKIPINKEHPLSPYVEQLNPGIYGLMSLVYGTLAVQNDMLYATIMTVPPGSIPLGNTTFQVLKRAFLQLVNNHSSHVDTYLPIYEFHQTIRNYYGVFPRVWGGFYWAFYIEGGFVFVIVITLVLLIVHRFLMIEFLRRKSVYSLLNLFLLYLTLCLSFIGSPLSLVFPIVLASSLRPVVNALISPIFGGNYSAKKL